MCLFSRSVMLALALSLSAASAHAQAPAELTNCTTTGIRNAVAVGGDYVFKCSGAVDNEDDGVAHYKKFINFAGVENQIVIDKPVSLDARNLGYDVIIARSPRNFDDPFLSPRMFKIEEGGSLTLKGLFIQGLGGVEFGAEGTEGAPGIVPGGNGGSAISAPQAKPAVRDGGCFYVALGGYLAIQDTAISGCRLNGFFGGYGGGGGAGARGENGTSGERGDDGVGFNDDGGDGTDGGNASPGGDGGAGGNGSPGGDARGGAIFNAGTLLLTNVTFSGNWANGGEGGAGGGGGPGGQGGVGGFAGNGGNGGPADLKDQETCNFNGTCGEGGDGGDSGDSAPSGSGANGGHGRPGGDGRGGAIYNAGQLTIHGAGFDSNLAAGGHGGNGASGGHGGPDVIAPSGGQGGAPGCFAPGGCGVQGQEGEPGEYGPGGAGGSGGSGAKGGDGFGGAIFSEGQVATGGAAAVTFTGNTVEPGAAGAAGAAGVGSAGNGNPGGAGAPGTSGSPNVGLKAVDPPTAAFSFAPDPEKPFEVIFDGRASKADPTGKIALWTWRFGNGESDTGARPRHKYAKPGRYEVKLTVRDSFGQEASITKTVEVRAVLDVTVKAKPAKIEVEQKPKGPKPEKVALKVTVKNPNPVTITKVKLPKKVDISLRDEPEATKKALKQKRPPTKKVDGKNVPDLNLGAIKKGDSESRTYELVLRGDGKYEVEALVTGADPDGKTVRGIGKDTVEGTTPLLFMKAELGARVRSPENRRFIKAGTNYLIHLELANRSYTKKIVVHPIYPNLRGNAAGGILQPPGRPVDFKPKGNLNEVRPSEYLEFGPRVKREFDILVRTTSSDSWRTADEGGNGGGTRSEVRFEKPKVSMVERGGALITRVPPKKVLLGEDSDKIVVHVDDSRPPRPEFNEYEATMYVAKGVVIGLWNITFGTVRGLLWDLPVAGVQTILSIPPAALAYMNRQVELWGEVEGDPVLREQFMREVALKTLRMFAETSYMNPFVGVNGVVQLGEAIRAVDRAVAEHYTKMNREWFDGDWRGAATAFGTEGTERFVDVATGVAPAVLARMPRVAAKWEATRTALHARAFSALNGTIREITGFRAAINALRGTVLPGLIYSNKHMTKLYGLAPREAEWARDFVKNYRTKLGRKISMVFRSRLEQSLHWLDNGGYLKPYWLKLKNVNRVDAEYLGYFGGPPAPGDIGRLIVRRPPSWEDVVKKLKANNVKPNSAEWEGVHIRWKQRDKEYYKGEIDQMFEYNRKGEVKGKWPWQENGVDPTVQVDEEFPAGFRLKRTGRPGEFAIEIRPQLSDGNYGEWGSVTGDVDLIALTAADGSALTDAEHVALLKAIREGPMGALHPESATWIKDGKFWFKAKENYLNNDGECCLAQVAADGLIRAVKFNPALSFFPKTIEALAAKAQYRLWWDGGYQAPPMPVPKGGVFTGPLR
ncbi:MAG TPA: PKD domain-containing protein [Thermoleophilaceae bacterium]|nr:PKD domain-containing protein [Thermoleophilaceae bacterium]